MTNFEKIQRMIAEDIVEFIFIHFENPCKFCTPKDGECGLGCENGINRFLESETEE